MSSQIGQALKVQLFGESHGPSVGVTLDGLPAGLKLDLPELVRFTLRRAARGALATGRRESDLARVLSGVCDGVTTGQPLCAVFDNADTHSSDYGFLPDCPRPGHADYPALVHSGGWDDLRGSGHHSGRLTLPYVFAGGVAVQLLATLGARIGAHALEIGGERDIALDPLNPDMDALERCHAREIPSLDEEAGERMRAVILAAKAEGDSVGGVVEVAAAGVPAGLGAPFFDGVEAVAGAHFFSIPAVKGVEFGAGFGAASLRGSRYNDPYAISGGAVRPVKNDAGGLLGGLTDGAPILARVAFRPTPSISLAQKSVSLSQGTERELTVTGRHDPCVALRAVPVVESALALALADLWLEHRGHQPLEAKHA